MRRLARAAALLGMLLLCACTGGSSEQVVQSGSTTGALPAGPSGPDQTACDDLAILEGLIAEYDEIVASGGTNLNSTSADFGRLADLATRLKAVAEVFESDADRLEVSSSGEAALLRTLASSVRGEAANLSLLRGVDSAALERQRSELAASLACPPGPSPTASG